jgi:hypothetical protein
VLEPIFEADLPPEIYAYRAGCNAQQAALEVEERRVLVAPKAAAPRISFEQAMDRLRLEAECRLDELCRHFEQRLSERGELFGR